MNEILANIYVTILLVWLVPAIVSFIAFSEMEWHYNKSTIFDVGIDTKLRCIAVVMFLVYPIVWLIWCESHNKK